ncbi:MAG: sensor histidine kinase, partial [Phycisphaerae bacterium]
VTAGPLQTVQGIWVDWPRLKRWLLGAVQDVLPGADLKPALPGESFPPSRLLASLPAVLDLPTNADVGFDGPLRLTPTRLTLLAAWAAAAAAVTAVGLVLRAVMALGERRLQFASAITHELRTPLTTLRMYSEMLAHGMVRDEQKRQDYLATLSREAERLAGLVENVLLYARIEQNRATTRAESLTVSELLERIRPRLARRAREAQMELVIDDGGVGDATLSVDCRAVEQILFNLVDNSCKYAGSAADRRLHLGVRTTPGVVEMLYRDHGPGIPPAEERRVFEAFRRADRDAQSATPGIGLGLALARGLARELNGDLKLLRLKDAGAAFSLTLPV